MGGSHGRGSKASLRSSLADAGGDTAANRSSASAPTMIGDGAGNALAMGRISVTGRPPSQVRAPRRPSDALLAAHSEEP